MSIKAKKETIKKKIDVWLYKKFKTSVPQKKKH